MVILNITSAEIKTKSANVLLKMTTILKELHNCVLKMDILQHQLPSLACLKACATSSLHTVVLLYASLQGPGFKSHVETGSRICLYWLLADCLSLRKPVRKKLQHMY